MDFLFFKSNKYLKYLITNSNRSRSNSNSCPSRQQQQQQQRPNSLIQVTTSSAGSSTNSINSLHKNDLIAWQTIKEDQQLVETNNNEIIDTNKQQNLLSSSSASSTSSSSSKSSSFVSANLNSNNINNKQANDLNQTETNSISINKNLINSSLLHLQLNNTNQQQQQQSQLNPINNSPDNLKKGSLISFKESATSSSTDTYKEQKKNYLTEKKRITNDISSIMKDERIIVLADWLKVRGSLKNWIKLYCILKPGIMLLFKSDKMKPGQWVGTIILNSCQVLERPSKKHGFCFKIFHPLERSIWATKGPSGETYINVPYMLLPTFYLIFRAPSEKVGQIWMDAIELSLNSTHLTKPGVASNLNSNSANLNESFKSFCSNSLSNGKIKEISLSGKDSHNSTHLSLNESLNQQESDNLIEQKHFKEIIDRDDTQLSDSDNDKNSSDEACSLNSSNANQEDNLEDEYFSHETSTNTNDEGSNQLIDEIVSSKTLNEQKNVKNNLDIAEKETRYIQGPKEEFGELGNKGQTEEVAEENKSLIFCLVKQVRPGMDLSKVVLPTFILEPRSFLEKLTDYYYHSDILAESINNDDPFERMKSVVKFYLSGFYKKPKGLKKPYNPILGEVFRSYWYNPKTDSKTFYIAEQVSHHPPITSFYVSNRKEGFCIYGTILARSKFYGNSVSAIMDGTAKLILLNRGEEYAISLPYANCKGILIGKLTMELGGKVTIECAKTGYSTEIDFKLKPLLGGLEASNLIEGKIKFAKETVAILNGKWDGEIICQEKRAEQKQTVLWIPNSQVIDSRLKRYIVPLEDQMDFESEKLWLNVSEAIKSSDQHLATEEKTKIETKQREEQFERRSKFIEYKSKLFSYDNINKEWIYNYSDLRPWDPQTDLYQYESDFKIMTKTKHNLKLHTRISDPRTSLLTIRNQTTGIRHRIVSDVVESNECLSVLNEQTTNQVLDQYNDIKQRLDQIEENLKSLCNKFTVFNSNKESLLTNKYEIDSKKHLVKLNLNNFLMLILLAWLFGVFTAFTFKN